MKLSEVKEKPLEEISNLIKEKKSELNDMLLKVRLGEQKDYSVINKSKKDIARLLTIENEKRRTS